MKRIISGVQSSGTPHIGNYLGAMKNHIDMQNTHESFIFIADLHALTTVRDRQKMQEKTMEIALDYLALGSIPKKLRSSAKAIFMNTANWPGSSTA